MYISKDGPGIMPRINTKHKQMTGSNTVFYNSLIRHIYLYIRAYMYLPSQGSDWYFLEKSCIAIWMDSTLSSWSIWHSLQWTIILFMLFFTFPTADDLKVSNADDRTSSFVCDLTFSSVGNLSSLLSAISSLYNQPSFLWAIWSHVLVWWQSFGHFGGRSLDCQDIITQFC